MDFARDKIAEHKVNRPEDRVVSEIIKKKCFQERFVGRVGQVEAPSSWKIVKLVFSRKLDSEPKKGSEVAGPLRSHR